MFHRMRKWRKMTWAIHVFNALMTAWLIGGIASASNTCSAEKGDAYISTQTAQDACSVGAGIGVALVLFLWFIGFIILAIVWFMTRPREQKVIVVQQDGQVVS